ncbi:MAG: hypothetical protein HN736_17840 [Anaerolineae bacterium]|jgi:hypothetical protein|nr:hypothetical protein [Anaerolineae bacterium]MBT7483770.1 hypothetical protein [Candidatus Peregrinibacteria bacterium]MBT3712670.1 hypothetical protein [Anaerolineae bacterium]MBT4310572.1 hypothetical protein [Anaerolineae bacterium]MBT4459866.1 hypothetical protein [Anaerolineae bacterium]
MTTSTLRKSPPIIISAQAKAPHPQVARLLAAAVVNKKFKQLLLSNPIQALDIGYQGEKFLFTRNERELIFSIQAKSLSELAGQLISSLGICSAYSDQHETKTEIRRVFKTHEYISQ